MNIRKMAAAEGSEWKQKKWKDRLKSVAGQKGKLGQPERPFGMRKDAENI